MRLRNALAVALVVTFAGAPGSAAATAELTVFTGENEGPVPGAFPGVNHRYTFDGYDTWDSVNDRPVPDAVGMSESCRSVGSNAFNASVPAHSVTLFTLTPQGRPGCVGV